MNTTLKSRDFNVGGKVVVPLKELDKRAKMPDLQSHQWES